MAELLEHLVEPARFIAQALRLLAPGGLLYATTPNSAGVSARLLGLRWSVTCPPEHIQLFSPSSLRCALELAGFTDVRIDTEGVNPYELASAARRALRRAEENSSSFERNATAYALNERLTSRRSGRLVKRLVNALARATRLGDSLKVYATAPRA
jgi:hypothetical protein